jgi:hypothetical protein
MSSVTLPFTPAISDAVLKTFAAWVETDAYGAHADPRQEPSQKIQTARHFIQYFMDAPDVAPFTNKLSKVIDLDMTFGEFLQLTFVAGHSGPGNTVKDLLFEALLRPNIATIVTDAWNREAQAQDLTELANPHFILERNELLSKRYKQQWEEAETQCASEAGLKALYDVLIPLYWKIVDLESSLKSFFYARYRTSGFRTWWPEYGLCHATDLESHTVRAGHATIKIEVRKYDGIEETPVGAYSWTAKLASLAAAEYPDAVAAGMVYVLPRTKGGNLNCTVMDLVTAADLENDMDVAELMALKRQTGNFRELMLKGDLCFVSIWERRRGVANGLGKQCLVAVLQDLKRRFPAIRTLAMGSVPRQFVVSRDEWEPAAITKERDAAAVRLVRYVRSIRPADILHGELVIINHDTGVNPNQVMCELGSIVAQETAGAPAVVRQ